MFMVFPAFHQICVNWRKRQHEGNERAQLALDMFHYRVRKYIGAYVAVMGGVDIIVFTGGIGENGSETREEICKGFEYMGLEFDPSKNDGLRSKAAIISKDESKVKSDGNANQ